MADRLAELLRVALFMPPEGGLKEQTIRQIAFPTQGVMECPVRATGLFEPEDEGAPARTISACDPSPSRK